MTPQKTEKKTTLKPLGNRVLAQREKQEETLKGGIILPDSAQEKPKQGEVLAVGPGKMDEEGRVKSMHVRVGDTVLFTSYAGTEVKAASQDEEYLIMSEEDILVVLC